MEQEFTIALRFACLCFFTVRYYFDRIIVYAQSIIQAGVSEFLLLKKETLAENDKICDKVGVSGKAFERQTDRCSRPLDR